MDKPICLPALACPCPATATEQRQDKVAETRGNGNAKCTAHPRQRLHLRPRLGMLARRCRWHRPRIGNAPLLSAFAIILGACGATPVAPVPANGDTGGGNGADAAVGNDAATDAGGCIVSSQCKGKTDQCIGGTCVAQIACKGDKDCKDAHLVCEKLGFAYNAWTRPIASTTRPATPTAACRPRPRVRPRSIAQTAKSVTKQRKFVWNASPPMIVLTVSLACKRFASQRLALSDRASACQIRKFRRARRTAAALKRSSAATRLCAKMAFAKHKSARLTRTRATATSTSNAMRRDSNPRKSRIVQPKLATSAKMALACRWRVRRAQPLARMSRP